MGLLPVDRGRISIHQEHIENLKPHEIVAHGISRTFQSVRLFPSLSILENVVVAQLFRSRTAPSRHLPLPAPRTP